MLKGGNQDLNLLSGLVEKWTSARLNSGEHILMLRSGLEIGLQTSHLEA